MGHVVVTRSAEIRQTTSNRQPARIVFGQFERVASHLHGTGKTAVQVHRIDIGQRAIGPLKGAGKHCRHRRRGMQITAIGDVPVIVRIGMAMQKHPALARDTEGARPTRAAHDQRRALIDERVGIHQPGIRKADHRIAGTGLGNRACIVAVAPIGQRITGGNGGKAGQQFAHCLLVLGQRAAAGGANCLFEQRIRVDGTTHPVAIFNVGPATLADAPGLRRAAGRSRPVEHDVSPLRRFLGGQCLAAGDQRHIGLAAADRLAEPVDAPLRHVAARFGINKPRCRGTQFGQQGCRRVFVRTERAGKAPTRIGK